MIDINYFEEQVLQNSDTADLHVVLSGDSFLYALVNKKGELIKLFFGEPESSSGTTVNTLIDSIHSMEKELPLDRIRVFSAYPKVAIFPEEVYHSAQIDLFERYRLDRDELILTQGERTSGNQIIHALPRAEFKKLENTFPQLHCCHLFHWMLQNMEKGLHDAGEHFIHGHLHGKNCFLIAVNEGKLSDAVVINFFSGNELLYYILLYSEKAGLDTRQSPVFLSGRIAKEGELWNALAKHLSKLQFLPVSSDLSQEEQFPKIPFHLVADLQKPGICGS